MKEKILDIQNLIVRFYTYEGVVKALDGVNLYLEDGETLGLIGESGCGKSVTSLSVLGLTPPPGRIESGKIFFRSKKKFEDLLTKEESHLRQIRGKDISIIFQEPTSSLNPVYNVEYQISEVFLQHREKEFVRRAIDKIKEDKDARGGRPGFILGIQNKIYEKMLEDPNSLSLRIMSRIPILKRYRKRLEKEVQKEVFNILGYMRIPDAERVAGMYPHQLSGGMKQRIVIAMALACNPNILIADEPTTNLDVTVQAQILHLVKILKKEFGSSVLYVTHDLGVVAEICDRVAVMYAGNIAEMADVVEIFKNPLHPYTKALLDSIPRPGKKFISIKGTVPNLIEPPSGCRFHPRCTFAMDICYNSKSEMKEITKEHFVACHLY